MYFIAPIRNKIIISREVWRVSQASPEPTDTPHNKNNLFDDLSSADKAMMKEAELYLYRSNNESEKTIKEKNMPKDRGRKAIKKPKQLKVKPEARYG